MSRTFVVDGGEPIGLLAFLVANADDVAACDWAREAMPGDVFPAFVNCQCVALVPVAQRQAIGERDAMAAELSSATTMDALRALYLNWSGLECVDLESEDEGDTGVAELRGILADQVREFCFAAGVHCPTFLAPLPEGYAWRTAPHGGAHVLANAEGADIGHAYRVPSGRWVGDPWGRERRHFEGADAETQARAWVEAQFQR